MLKPLCLWTLEQHHLERLETPPQLPTAVQMTNSDSLDKPVAPSRLTNVQRANRGILIVVLLGGGLFSLFLTELGVSDAVAFCLDAVVVLVALQLLLNGTTDSPWAVLKRYREINLPVVLGLTALVFVSDSGLLSFVDAFLPQFSTPLFAEPIATLWELLLSVLAIAVLAPFYEELVFRGVALKAYRDARSTLFAVLFTSALFGLVHGSLIFALVIFPSSILFALAVLKTGQLWNVVAVHALGNLTAVLLDYFGVGATSATPPAFGVLGLVVAAAAFWLGVRWLGFPTAEPRLDEGRERGTIWTRSLVVVLILTLIGNILTTYELFSRG